MKSNTFIKSIFISFLLHILGLSLFSIFLPLPLKKRVPIEVIIYPELKTEKLSERKVLISKEVENKIGTYKIKPLKEIKDEKISPTELIGEKKYKSHVNISLDFEKFDFKVPSLPQLNLKEEDKGEIIEGPAGKRKLIYKEKIEYPIWAQKEGLEGKVKIKFWVNPEGKIFNTEIYSSSGYPEIDFYAEENFKKWIFEPVNTDKDVWGIITIVFKLK